MIDSFWGEYRFLSNFYPAVIEYEGIVYPTSEHAYQAQKTMNQATRRYIASLPTPGLAKQYGAKLALRPGWNSMRISIMEDLLRLKFAPDTELAEMLIATGDHELVEGNTWYDRYWGVCDGEGSNHLGKLLMKIRSDLNNNQIFEGFLE